MGIFVRAIVLAVVVIVSSSIAQAQTNLPPNTINCADFKKLPNGLWHVAGTTTFEIETNTMTIGDTDIAPHSNVINGFDLYDLLERKCGRH
jgi:hypothetical protein